MDFRLLGPVEVGSNGRTLPLGGPKARTLLAHLLLEANRVVSADRLIDAIWGDEPPDTARNTLQTYIRHLRKALGGERIQYRSSGYAIMVDTDQVDALRFDALVQQARGLLAVDPSESIRILQEALGLWKGPALADLSDQASLRSEIARLEELRLAAVEDRLGAQLAVGGHRELVPELGTLISAHPLRERLWGYAMVALYRSGRQGDALAAYQRARETLREHLGIDPSAELQRLHEQILRQDPGLELESQPLRGYRLLNQIGAGAFGAVHRAFQPQVGREVAVKIIRAELANQADFIRRFGAEAQLVARLEHPYIVPLYDYWREPDAAYLVMRYLRGGSLRDMLQRGALATGNAVRLIDQMALALTAAHRQGVVHRDVKPANVLFDEEGNAYLSDFGIAKDFATLDEAWTSLGTGSGPAYYISPEEIRGEPATPRTDLYGLGILLYESLAARHPFEESSSEAVLERHASEPLPPLRDVRADLPAAVDQVIARATAKRPEERYEDARSLAIAVRKALGSVTTRSVMAEPVESMEVRNPYKGLRPFLEADAADFFGRDSHIDRLVARMSEVGEGSRFLALVGPSGSGKSSLVRAGLIPALRRGALPGSDSWFVVDMIPGAHPFEELGEALIRIAADPTPKIVERMLGDDYGLMRVAEDLLPPDGSELLLLIDQFEEIFQLVEDEDVRTRFLDVLRVTTTDPRSRVRIITTLRADFYDRPLSYKGFGDLLAARTQALTPLSVEELEQAVSRPAETVGITIDPAVVVEIVGEVADQPGGLPLLQYALTELFEQRQGRSLTPGAYRKVGGVTGALARRAEQLYAGMSEAGKEATRHLFLRLVAVGDDGSEDTRRRITRAELRSLDVDGDAMEAAINTFANRRLLSSDRDPATRGPTVEVAHEALLSEWTRLRGWIDDAREDLRTERRLAVAAREWIEAGRESSFLVAGSRLKRFETWRDGRGLAMTSDERQFLEASLAERERRRAEEVARATRERALERQSTTRLMAVLGIGLLAVAAIAVAILLLGPQDAVLGSVRPNTLARIDIESGDVLGGIPVGSRPTGVAVGGGTVWVANQDADTVSAVDPADNAVTDLGTRGSPTAVAVGEGAAWIVNGFDGTITRIDGRTNAARTIPLDPGTRDLAVGEGYLWVTNAIQGLLIRIDPDTLDADTFDIGGRPGSIALGDGSVWIVDGAGDPGALVQIDPSDGRVLARMKLDVEPTQVAVGGRSVWISSSLADVVVRIDPSRMAVTTRIKVGNEPHGVAAGGGSVWVANAADGTLVRIDPSRNVKVDRIQLGASPEGVAIGEGAVWVSVRAR
jgi:serine/threonine protein kinase/DNA-binding beta-propeller fold protein YncE